ncbi:MAG: SDR family oxidoreductase [Candidatus Thermoplasmatota archaeon]|nr:SDR family oxidoreductase [Candidatus Thermoplasmatota archaeon]
MEESVDYHDLYSKVMLSSQKEKALVTGASSGIGREIARVLGSQGCNLVITARRRGELEALAKELTEKYSINVEVVAADLSEKVGVENVIRETGDVDILINNAGFGFQGEHLSLNQEGQLNMIDLNIRALTHLARHYGAAMKKRGSGRILNVASIAGFQPGPNMAVYCATKAYVLSYTRALHSELKKSGVSVTALCPGFVETGFQEVAGMKLGKLELSGAIPADKVAKTAVKAMRKGRREIIPGWLNKPIPYANRLVPISLNLAVVKRLMS